MWMRSAEVGINEPPTLSLTQPRPGCQGTVPRAEDRRGASRGRPVRRAGFLLDSEAHADANRVARRRSPLGRAGTDTPRRRVRPGRPRRRAPPAGLRALPARAAGSHRAAARRRAPPARRPHRRRQEPRLPASGHLARRHHARRLAADLAHAGPGTDARGARHRGHLPGLDPRRRRDATAPRRPRRRPPRPRLRRPRAARLPGVSGASARARVPAGRHRRGPLHQRVGARLPAGIPGAGRGPGRAEGRRASWPAPPPRRRWSATRS